MFEQIKLYLHRQADGLGRYILERTLYTFLGWIPTVFGIALRGFLPIDLEDGWTGCH
jgi:hypothetical protein